LTAPGAAVAEPGKPEGNVADQLPLLDPLPCPKENSDNAVYVTVYDAKPSYEICIDQANQLRQARIVANRKHYITTFSFGKLLIRHWPDVVPVVTITGAGVSLTQAGLAGVGVVPGSNASAAGAASSPTASTLSDGQGISVETADHYLLSTVFIPPHAPGAMHLDIKFVERGDARAKATPAATSAMSSASLATAGAVVTAAVAPPASSATGTTIDLAVDQGYSGAVRFGVGHVFGAHDHSYSKLQRGPDQPKEIVETAAAATEVVVGYALFLDGLGWRKPAGRTYALRNEGVGAFITRHTGIFFGFGALSYSPSNIDFLKSIHAGIEIEFTRNLSIAATVVYRRTSQLDGGLRAGGPAPEGDILTATHYEPGFGLTLNFSTDFLKFATAAPTTGASK
jgi:hypothetical protein